MADDRIRAAARLTAQAVLTATDSAADSCALFLGLATASACEAGFSEVEFVERARLLYRANQEVPRG